MGTILNFLRKFFESKCPFYNKCKLAKENCYCLDQYIFCGEYRHKSKRNLRKKKLLKRS